MHPTNLRMLIIGVALLIFGPILGYGLLLFGFFQAASPPPLNDFNAVMLGLQETPRKIIGSFFHLIIGYGLGGLGLFLIVLSFIRHFLSPPPVAANNPNTTAAVPARPTATSYLHVRLPIHEQDDSRYMPPPDYRPPHR